MDKDSSTIYLGSTPVGLNYPPYFIAEIGSNHEGSLTRAKDLISLAKSVGANAVKFQSFLAESLVSPTGFATLPTLNTHQANWANDVISVYRNAQTPVEWFPHLLEHCRNTRIDFFTTPYDLSSLNRVADYCPFFKIGSGDITWIAFVESIAELSKPVLLATGASDWVDVKRAAHAIMSRGTPCILMQCNTNYTNHPENKRFYNLNVLKEYGSHFPECVLGLSDHTQGHTIAVYATVLGARVIEKHFTDDTTRTGPDHGFAMDPSAWKLMVLNCNDAFYSLGDGIKRVEPNEVDTRIVQQRAIRAAQSMARGHKITESDLVYLRPCPAGAARPFQNNELIGRILTKDIVKHEVLSTDDVI